MVRHLGISKQALHKQLAKLIELGEVEKVGQPPKVFYSISEKITLETKATELDPDISKVIEEHYLYISPGGRKMGGLAGFEAWCHKQNLPISKTATEYAVILEPYLKLRKNSLLDGTRKITTTFKKSFLDKLYYLDFYSIPRFGKTKLGQLVLYAKQSQDRQIIRELLAVVEPQIQKIVRTGNYDAVGFVPPSVKRQVQLMSELERSSLITLPKLGIEKIKTQVTVPQKSLSKLEDRVENAKATFVITKKGHYNKVLLIDDVVGSGATMNELAAKLKDGGIAKQVIGLALVGSLKGYDVISEV